MSVKVVRGTKPSQGGTLHHAGGHQPGEALGIGGNVGVRVTAIEATGQGLPALAAIDPLLKASLGDRYEKTYEAPIQAGYLVALMMRKKGVRTNRPPGPPARLRRQDG